MVKLRSLSYAKMEFVEYSSLIMCQTKVIMNRLEILATNLIINVQENFLTVPIETIN